MTMLRSNEVAAGEFKTSEYVVENKPTPGEEAAAVKPIDPTVTGALTAKHRSDAAIHVSRVARGSVARMRIKQWQQNSPPTGAKDVVNSQGETLSAAETATRLGRTASVPTMKLNRKFTPSTQSILPIVVDC